MCLLPQSYCRASPAFVGSAWNKVQNDLAALTRRVTARHILVANEEIALALKRKMRDECVEKEAYVVEVFEQAAQKYSRDETTNQRGGLLGDLVPQGYCRSPQLDQYCFQVPLGSLEGPLESEFGYHLVLVTERTNCPKLDGSLTKLTRTSSSDVFGTLVPSQQVGKVDVGEMVVNQAGFWFFTFLAGGVVAELAEKLATPLIGGGGGGGSL
jgi:peptidyl-prolyl cis-trans isomerase C